MEFLLIAWTVAAFAWWAAALSLIGAGRRRRAAGPLSSERPPVTLFKPLPPTHDDRARATLGRAVETFLAQLRPGDQLLLGLDHRDLPIWQPLFDQWRARWPAAMFDIVAREMPRQCANPKIAWMQTLAPRAKGEFWLWSDADVFATPRLVDSLYARGVSEGILAVTAPYRIQEVGGAHDMLDALFVNVEFLPGALLLDRLGRRNLAYGAATLFRKESFESKCDWQELGAVLADDHKLGEWLEPVVLAEDIVSTVPLLRGWRDALRHYYRWHKTVRWCRPPAYAAMILVMPAMGWAWAALASGGHCLFLSGLAAVLAGELGVAWMACRLAGCPWRFEAWIGASIWTLTRPITWLLAWVPLPVIWSERHNVWFGPRQP